GVYPRYLLVVSLPLCLAIAAELAVRPRLLVPAWTAVTVADLALWLSVELATPPQPGYYAELPRPAVVGGAVAVAPVVGSALLGNWVVATTGTAATAAVRTPTSVV